MNVTIIAAGNMGRGIGHRLVAGGHDVTVVDRDPEEAERLAEELRGAAPLAAVRGRRPPSPGWGARRSSRAVRRCVPRSTPSR